MAVISKVAGLGAHPLYGWLRDAAGFEPEWNFDKVLLNREGRVAGRWRSFNEQFGLDIVQAVERVLAVG